MTWKDKLEIGLKEDAPFRKDNLPEDQVRGPEVPAGPGRSPVVPAAREDKTAVPAPTSTGLEGEPDTDNDGKIHDDEKPDE
jgi:hypothetical protein